MKRLNRYIEMIRKQFPETMSKEQFYKIAHISKATAQGLLSSGIVPCTDSGKKTRRYTIRTDDVVKYLEDIHFDPRKFQAPRALRYTKESGDFFSHMNDAQRAQLRKHFEQYFKCCDDLMSAIMVADQLGYSKSAVAKWCESGKVKSFYVSGKYLIPKICLIDYLMSSEAMCVRQKSFRYELLLKEFLEKKGERKE